MKVRAFDIILRLPPAITKLVARLNGKLETPPAGFRFDETHLPHITLVQQFSPVDAIRAMSNDIRAIVAHTLPLRLTTGLLTTGEITSTLTVHRTATLDTLHRQLMNQLAPFDVVIGDKYMFDDVGNDEPARDRDVTWVTRFRTDAAYDAFDPHITLGVGKIDSAVREITFDVSEIELCVLGRFCTCRRIVESWSLDKS